MNQKYPNNEQHAIDNRPEPLPSRKQRDRLFELKSRQLLTGEAWTPKTDLEYTLWALTPQQRPLPEIQIFHESCRHLGVMQSDPQARFRQLRRLGFVIHNRIDRSGGSRSWYWLELDSSGRPLLRDVPLRDDVKTGKPKAAAAPVPSEQPKPPQAISGKQESLFGEEPQRLRSAISL